MLSAWFKLNKVAPEANCYIYDDIPKYFVRKNNMWQRRIHSGGKVISRMYSVNPKDIEKYFLRLLLCHVPGANCFADLCMHDSIQYDTFNEACIVRNLLEDDGECLKCLKGACNFQINSDSYFLAFVSSAIQLHHYKFGKNSNLHFVIFLFQFLTEESHRQTLDHIRIHLKVPNVTFAQCGLPQFLNSLQSPIFNGYNVGYEKQEEQISMNMSNPEQRVIFYAILHAIQYPDFLLPRLSASMLLQVWEKASYLIKLSTLLEEWVMLISQLY